MSLTTNIVGYWKLDGNSNDSVASNNGTDTSITYSAGNGIIIQGAGFNGTTSSILFGTFGISGSQARTVSFWMKTTTFSGYIFTSGPFTATNKFLIYNAGSGKIGVNTWEAQDMQTSSNPMNSGSWNHVVVTYAGSASLNSTSTKVYINGSVCSTNNPSTSTLNTTDTANYLGQNGTAANFITAAVDELGLWSRALTSAEVTQLYNGGAGLQYPFTGTNSAMLAFF